MGALSPLHPSEDFMVNDSSALKDEVSSFVATCRVHQDLLWLSGLGWLYVHDSPAHTMTVHEHPLDHGPVRARHADVEADRRPVFVSDPRFRARVNGQPPPALPPSYDPRLAGPIPGYESFVVTLSKHQPVVDEFVETVLREGACSIPGVASLDVKPAHSWEADPVQRVRMTAGGIVAAGKRLRWRFASEIKELVERRVPAPLPLAASWSAPTR